MLRQYPIRCFFKSPLTASIFEVSESVEELDEAPEPDSEEDDALTVVILKQNGRDSRMAVIRRALVFLMFKGV
jgi:hypothetical protein